VRGRAGEGGGDRVRGQPPGGQGRAGPEGDDRGNDRGGARRTSRANVTKDGKNNHHILISDREPGLPYSKGLMASRVMVTGLAPYRSYQVAERIEEVLEARGTRAVTTEELSTITVRVLAEMAGERYAKNFVR